MKTEKTDWGLQFPSFQKKADLNDYLLSPVNVEINQVLSDCGMDEDERFAYIEYLDRQTGIILTNLDKPASVLKYLLKGLYQEDEKEDIAFLLENLHVIMTYTPEYKHSAFKGKMDILLDMIDDEIYRLLEELYPDIYGDGVDKSFRRIMAYSKSDEDYQTQLTRVVNIRTGLKQFEKLHNLDDKNKRLIRLLDLEIMKIEILLKNSLSKTKNSDLPDKDDSLSNETPNPLQVNKKNEITEQNVKTTPDHSALLLALSKYISGINTREFDHVIEHHKLTPGTPRALWIGKPVDAHRFASYIKMNLPNFNKCFSFSEVGKLKAHHKDNLEKESPLIEIMKSQLKE